MSQQGSGNYFYLYDIIEILKGGQKASEEAHDLFTKLHLDLAIN